MIAYWEQAIFSIIGSPLLMALWVALTSMLYLLHVRAHMFRPWGTFRLFATSGLMGVVLPLVSLFIGWLVATQLDGMSRRFVIIITAPFLVILVFALAVTLIQRFLGADAETAMNWAWPIALITYVIPFAFCFIYAIFHQKWLTGEETLY
ncbi:MAG: hypothetical protein ACUVX8_06325 [Candidatus Zipacnadales bacterium]